MVKMVTTTVNQSEISNEDEIRKLLVKEKPPTPYNPWWMVSSFLMVVTISVFLYIVPTWHIAEVVTRDIVVHLLKLTGINAFPSDSQGVFFPFVSATTNWSQFGEASPSTPGVVIPGSGYEAFWIVKACTGMQAGAILIALIYVTPLPIKGKLRDPNINPEVLGFRDRFHYSHPTLYSILHKTSVAILFYFVLFFTNAVRIWFHLYLVGAFGLPFSFAHDDLSKPIGFVGTLMFAWIIEKSGIPIIDTFADWLDSAYFALKGIYNKIL